MMYRGIGAAAVFCAGILAAEPAALSALWWATASLAAAAAAFRLARWRWLFVLCCFFLAGGARLQLASEQYDQLPHYLGGAALHIEGRIQDKGSTYEKEEMDMTRYVLSVDRFAYADEGIWHAGKGAVYITVPDSPSFQPSARVAFHGELRPIRYYNNNGAYDAKHRDKEKHIFLKGYSDAPDSMTIMQPAQGWQYRVSCLRETITRRFQHVLGHTASYIMSSLLFGGHYDSLPPELVESFSTTGLIHILSVSGSHIALLLSVMQIIGRAAGLGGKSQFFLSAGFVMAYGAMAEFVAPVVRASIMGLICSFSVWARRDYLSVQALAAAVLLMLMYSPYLAYDLSFRLSCGASAGIVLFHQTVRTRLAFLPALLRDNISVCVCAQVLLLPLLLANFHAFPVYSLAANLLVAPVLDMVIVLGLAAALLGFVWELPADAVLFCLKPLLALAIKGNYFLSSLPHSRYWAGAMSPLAVLAWYMSISAVWLCPKYRRWMLSAAAAAVIASWGWGQWHRPDAVVHIFDVGQDKATCVVYGDDSAYLWYNKSSRVNPEQAAYVLTPALRYEGIFRLTGCIVSGSEPQHTAAQLEKHFALEHPCRLSDGNEPVAAVQGTIPYYLYDGMPQGRLADGACLEIRQLLPYSGETFPSHASALILYRSSYHERYHEWKEGAAMYGIPCFSPSDDGQITGTYRRGRWTFAARGRE